MQRLMATAEYGLVEESARRALRKENDSMTDRAYGHLKQGMILELRAWLPQHLREPGACQTEMVLAVPLEPSANAALGSSSATGLGTVTTPGQALLCTVTSPCRIS